MSKMSMLRPRGASSLRAINSLLAHETSGPHCTRSSVKPCEAKYFQKTGSRAASVSFLKPTVAPTVTRQNRLVGLESEVIGLIFKEENAFW